MQNTSCFPYTLGYINKCIFKGFLVAIYRSKNGKLTSTWKEGEVLNAPMQYLEVKCIPT